MAEVQLRFFPWGSCRAPGEALFAGGGWRWLEQPVLVGLLHHPERGRWLIDTGLHPRLSRCPWYYRWFLKLSQARVPASAPAVGELQGIFLSHFHLDHGAGLRDFPGLPVIASRRGYRERGFGWCDSLLPEDFSARAIWVEDLPRRYGVEGLAGFDLFGDGSALAVDLSGHAPGMHGLLCRTPAGPVLFAADAAAHRRVLQGASQRLPGLLALDRSQERRTRARLQHLSLLTILSHCPEAYRALE